MSRKIIYMKNVPDRQDETTSVDDYFPEAEKYERKKLFVKHAVDFAEQCHISTIIDDGEDCLTVTYYFGEIANLQDIKGLISMADDSYCVAGPGDENISISLDFYNKPTMPDGRECIK